MSETICDVDADSLEALLETTVEVPAVLLLGAACCGCGCGGGCRGPWSGPWRW